jgi:hypothetical protein
MYYKLSGLPGLKRVKVLTHFSLPPPFFLMYFL